MTGQIGIDSIEWMVIASAILIVLPLAAVIVWKYKTRESLAAFWGGVVGFLLFSRILESVVHVFCIVLDNPVSRAINGSTFLYILYGCVMAGVFEEAGRYIVFRFMLRKHRTPQTAIGYGIGHGGIEVYVNVAITLVVMAVLSVMYNKGGIAAIGENNAALVSSAVGFSGMMCFFFVIERISAMAFHVAASVIVFASVKQKQPKLLLLAIVLHGIVDIPAALSQRGVLSIAAFEVVFALLIAAVCVIAWKYWRILNAAKRMER